MKDPKTLYDLRYYARRRGYLFNKKEKVVTITAGKRSQRVEERLKGFGYNFQLNLFSDEKDNSSVLPPSRFSYSLCKAVTPQIPEKRGGVMLLNVCNFVTCY